MLFYKNGNSLVQVIVAAGIASIIALGVMQMMSNQHKEVKAIDEKLLTKGLEGTIRQAILDSNYCSCLFRGKTFNTTTTTWNTALANLPLAFTAVPPFPTACTGSADSIVPAVGANLNGSNLTVQSLGVTGSTELIIGSGKYLGDIEVGFNNSIRSIKNVKIGLIFTVNTAAGTAAARPFVSCTSGAASSDWVKNVDNTIFYNTANVGIGTSTPAYKLEVNGAVGISAGSGLYLDAGVANAMVYKDGANNLVLATAGNFMKMVLNQSGNVGIGTTTPASKLDVNGSISAGTYANTAAPANGMIISGNVGIGYPTAPDPLSVQVSGSGNTVAASFANGVGGATIASTNIAISAAGFQTTFLRQNNTVAGQSHGGPLDTILINTHTSGGGNLHLGTNNLLRMTILNTGNVGIGTTGPSYKLDVAGDINTSTCFRIGATTVSGSCTSDERLKENVHDYDAGLSDLLNIKLHTYTFNGLGEMPKTGEIAITLNFLIC